MSTATHRVISRLLARQKERILELWQERTMLSSSDYEAGRAIMATLIRSLEDGESGGSASVGFEPFIARAALEAMRGIDQLQDLVLEAIETEQSFTFTDRFALLRCFNALRYAVVEKSQARQQELEATVLRSEERYLSAARAAGFAIWDWHLDGRGLEWSRNVEALLGHPVEALATWDAWLEHVHQADRERIGMSLYAAIETGQGRWSESFQFLRRDGTYASVLGRAWISHDDTASGVHVIGGLIDVTEQRQLEQRLKEIQRENEVRFQAFVKATSEVVYRMSPDWSEMRFFKGQDFITDTADPSRGWLAKYIHPADEQHVLDAIQEAIRTKGVFELEHRVRQVDGTLGWTLSRAVPLLNGRGEVIEWFGTASDVTGRKRAEALSTCQRLTLQRLVEGASLHQVLEFLIESFEAQAASSDLHASILLLNSAGTHFERALGLSMPPGFNAAVLGLAVSSGITICCQAVVRRQAVAVVNAHTDSHRSRFSELLVPYGLTAGWSTPIIGSDGRVIGTFATYFYEQCDPVPRDMQWVEVVTRTAAIAIERAQAAEKLHEEARRKDEFLAMLAHELRNPLAPITAASEFLLHTSKDNERARPSIEIIKRQTAQLTRLVDDLLDIARITQGTIQLSRQSVDLAGVLRRRSKRLSLTGARRGSTFPSSAAMSRSM
jgi:PAS domain S-box-containing protein